MTCRLISLITVLALAAGAASNSSPKLTSIRVEPEARTLVGAGASQQLLVTAEFSDGSEQDVTDRVTWKLSDPALARIDPGARLFAVADGTLTLTASFEGHSARSTLRMEQTQVRRPFSFGRDIGGIF